MKGPYNLGQREGNDQFDLTAFVRLIEDFKTREPHVTFLLKLDETGMGILFNNKTSMSRTEIYAAIIYISSEIFPIFPSPEVPSAEIKS